MTWMNCTGFQKTFSHDTRLSFLLWLLANSINFRVSTANIYWKKRHDETAPEYDSSNNWVFYCILRKLHNNLQQCSTAGVEE